MEKINFENKPNTTTPINATNLNLLQDNAENDIGLLSNLETSDKSNLVNAINEANNVIESGTNYLKFKDGALICTGAGNGTNDSYTTINFPQNFISAPRVVATITSANTTYMKTVACANVTTSSARFFVYWWEIGTATGGIGADAFNYVAIGKWK